MKENKIRPKDNIFFFIKVDLICCQICGLRILKLTPPDILIDMFNYQIIYIYYTHTKKKKKNTLCCDWWW